MSISAPWFETPGFGRLHNGAAAQNAQLSPPSRSDSTTQLAHSECPNLPRSQCENVKALSMPAAIEFIVRTYVRLKKRRALEEMLLHRQRLALGLRRRSGFAIHQSILQVDEDIAAIKAGLAELGKTAAVPPVGWI